MKDLILGIDIGTTGVKALLINAMGDIVFETTKNCDLLSPKPGFAEEDPNVWWNNVKEILSEISTEFGRRIASIGVSGMVPTLILIDENGKPLYNSIQQNDSRAIEEIEYFKKMIDKEVYFSVTGNTVNQQVIFPKFLWLRKHVPDKVKHTRWIMGSYNFINFKLTGIPNLEKNWALESGLWKIEDGWYKDILDASEIPESILPEVYEPWDIVGGTTRELEEETGIPEGIPVTAGSADHIASALAVGMSRNGDLLLKFGGAGDILFVTEQLKLSKKLFIDYHDIPNCYVLNGCMASSGSIVKWFKNEFAPNVNFDELTEMARTAGVGSGGIVMLPYFIGEKTPIFDAKARGTMVGLSLFHNKGHMFRSILEAVAFGFRHHVEVIEEMGFAIERVFMSNGGAKNELWRQIVADVVGYDAVYITNHPGSSLGAAFIAGKATGMFEDWDEINKFLKTKEKISYDQDNHEVYSKYYEIYRDTYTSLKSVFEKLYEVYHEKSES